jgi:hypothetical protein
MPAFMAKKPSASFCYPVDDLGTWSEESVEGEKHKQSQEKR